MKGIEVISVGHYAPDNVVTNEMMSKYVETSDEWIVSRTGIENRRFVKGENTIALAAKAASQAIERGGVDRSRIGTVIVATFTPEYFSPSVACMMQKELGLDNDIFALDINAGCTGFIYGIRLVHSILNQEPDKYALLIGSEVISKMVDFEDRNTCVLFGDGAGAAILRACDEKPFYCTVGAEGNKDDLRVGGVPLPGEKSEMHVYMDGSNIFKFAVDTVPKTINALLDCFPVGTYDRRHSAFDTFCRLFHGLSSVINDGNRLLNFKNPGAVQGRVFSEAETRGHFRLYFILSQHIRYGGRESDHARLRVLRFGKLFDRSVEAQLLKIKIKFRFVECLSCGAELGIQIFAHSRPLAALTRV
jgi:3-oxoacyl-[acyl-carrier-protein] synthase-3